MSDFRLAVSSGWLFSEYWRREVSGVECNAGLLFLDCENAKKADGILANLAKIFGNISQPLNEIHGLAGEEAEHCSLLVCAWLEL